MPSAKHILTIAVVALITMAVVSRVDALKKIVSGA
jgi:hypothetical protein